MVTIFSIFATFKDMFLFVKTKTKKKIQNKNKARLQDLQHLLVVDTHTRGSFMRAYVSCGPPRQAAQEGEAGVSQPASAKIWAAVRPSQPGTGRPKRSKYTFWVAGTRKVGTFTCKQLYYLFLLADNCVI